MKVLFVGTAKYPNVISIGGVSLWADPLPSVYGGTAAPGYPSGYSYTDGQALFAPYDCKDADTPVLARSLVGSYSCYFRPDRTK